MSAGHNIADAAQALTFILAGKSTVTFKSLNTGDHLTFNIKRPKKAMYGITHFVQARTGNDYARIGLIRADRFEVSRNAELPADSKEIKAFAWVFANLMQRRVPPLLEIWHEGRCGMCSRPLTDPDSIASGIGPECRKKLHCEAA